MNNIGVMLFIILLPIVLITIFVNSKDKNKEPIGLLAQLFGLGMLSCLLTLGASLLLDDFLPFMKSGSGSKELISIFLYSFIGVALIEEVSKWIFIYIRGYKSKYFDELYDIIVYAIYVSLGFAFCSTVSLTTSYYMLIDCIGMSVCISCIQNGVLYVLLPITGSFLLGINGMWAGFVLAPILTLTGALMFVYLRFGKGNFPFLLKYMDSEILVMDDILTAENAAALSERVRDSLLSHQYPKAEANRASLFVEEIGLTILEKNKQSKKPVLLELSLFFEPDSVLIVERDSGELFDLTDPDLQIRGMSGFILSGLMEAHKEEKAYLVTTGYNRNMIRFLRTGVNPMMH